jgi:hypothetical protein
MFDFFERFHGKINMEDSEIKQDKILSAIGLKRLMVWEAPTYSIYDETKFKNYVTPEYRESQRKVDDEFYRMFEVTLLHLETGLRITLSTSESYDGETVEYKLMNIFIITQDKEQLEVLDADFEKKIFYTETKEIPFSMVVLSMT